VTHTSCYDNDLIGQVAGGGPGAVYRIDGVTGAITTFCRLPNYPDPNIFPGYNLPGLGNISYDCRHKQFFVTNLEDGRIYRITPNGVNAPTGTIQQVFDPGVADTGPTNYLTPIGSVPSPGWAPLGERLWGVQWHMDRVFYSVWAEDGSAASSTVANEIRSVALNGLGAFVGGSDQHELFLPALPGGFYSMPVSDISFHASGKMLLAERGISGSTSSSPHQARNLEYGCEAGCWLPANAYQIGDCCGQINAGGGVDYDRFPYAGGPVGRVWASSDAIHLGFPYTDTVYGYQGSRPTGGSNTTAIIIDDDGNVVDQDKTLIGDVEAPGCVNTDVGQICGQKFKDLNRNGIKENGEPALAGWTIVLNGPGGPYTATTDGQGNYCFVELPPGSYTLGEVGQAGWVQTAPAGGTWAFSLTGGQNLTNRDFGNYACPPTPPCVLPPPGMSAWYTFDEAGGTTAAADAAHPSPAKNALQLFGGAGFSSAGMVGNALHFGGAADYARLPNIQQAGLDFGAGSFAFDAWVNVAAGTANPRVIAESANWCPPRPTARGLGALIERPAVMLRSARRKSPRRSPALPSRPTPGRTWPSPWIAEGRSPRSAPGPWTACRMRHSASHRRPARSSTTPTCTSAGAARPSAPACRSTATWTRSSSSTVRWRRSRRPPSRTPARPASARSIAACRRSPRSARTRPPSRLHEHRQQHERAAELPLVHGRPARRPGLHGQRAHQLQPGRRHGDGPPVEHIPEHLRHHAAPRGAHGAERHGLLRLHLRQRPDRRLPQLHRHDPRRQQLLGVTPVQTGVVNVGSASPAHRRADRHRHPSLRSDRHHGLPVSAVYEPGDHPDPHAVSLNGLLPASRSRHADPGPGGGVDEPPVSVPSPSPPATTPPALPDRDGRRHRRRRPLERVSCTPIASTYESDPVAGVPVEPITPQALRLMAMPNPFRSGATTVAFTLPVASVIDLAVYDISGRLVRSLQSGPLPAGTQNILWDGRDENGRDTAGGIYFVRLRADKALVQTKVVKVR
jgi:hypothetical protein